MKKIMSTLKAWWSRQSTRKKVFILGALALILIIILKSSGSADGTVIESVKRQNLKRTISASGTVVSSTDLSLGFEQSKMVSSIKVSVGDKVKKGDILATLSNGTERAAVSSARGSLLAARARYNKVIEGSSSEEVKLAEIQLDNAKKTQQNLVDSARRKLYSTDLVADPKGGTSGTTPLISGTYNGTAEGEYRIEFTQTTGEIKFTGLERGIGNASSLPKPLGTKGLLITFPTSNYSLGSNWEIKIPNTSGPNYTTNLNNYQEALSTQEAVIAEKQAELDLKKATARQPDVDAALADMVTAQAQVDTANAAYEKTILRAPSDGTITAVSVKIGEISKVGEIAIALQDVSNLYLEAKVNESNIKSVVVGQPILVTFDAFTGDSYNATVSSIDPAATIENNVVNYKIKALLTNTENIRPGMTANMTVITAEISNVLVLPGRVIEIKDGVSSVSLLTDERKNKTTPRIITTGLKGDGDLVEIISGLLEGDRVLWSVPK